MLGGDCRGALRASGLNVATVMAAIRNLVTSIIFL